MKTLTEFRREKDKFLGEHFQSPLTDEQKHVFTGLNYYPENPDLKFKVIVEKFSEKQVVTMQTSTGDLQTYLRFGRFKFYVNDQLAELTIFSSEDGYFLPFVDALAGKETYGAGRYLEPRPLDGGMFLIDFNYAYNPYCAYNENWSCPIPPAENRLNVPIRAGEKIFGIH
jgi:uncharacterized protein (DUF1684 family)